jgi:hypothetical protein
MTAVVERAGHATPPHSPSTKRKLTRVQRRRLARATAEAAKEAVTYLPGVQYPVKP